MDQAAIATISPEEEREAEERQAAEPRGPGPRRIPLPLSSGVNILPGTTATITARSQLDQFWFRRLLIKNAQHWVVHDVRSGEQSLFSREVRESIPGAEFAVNATESPLRVDEPMGAGDPLSVEVTYVGQSESGESFECCALGGEQPSERDPDPSWMTPAATAVDEAREVSIEYSSEVFILWGERPSFCAASRASSEFWPERLAIEDAPDWIVHDVVVGGESLLLNEGENAVDLPGVMFSDGPNRQPISMGHLLPGDEFEILATYVGSDDHAVLRYRLTGPRRSRDRARGAPTTLVAISSGVNILPMTSAQMTARVPSVDEEARDLQILPVEETAMRRTARRRTIPEGCGFRPLRVVVDRADDWVVGDFKIGNLSQFAQSGDVPGATFAWDVAPGLISFDPARPGIDVTIIATNVGESESGSPFVCVVAGDLVFAPSAREATRVDPASVSPTTEGGTKVNACTNACARCCLRS